MNRPATIRKPVEGRRIGIVGDVSRFLATGQETGGKYATFEAIVPIGSLHSFKNESGKTARLLISVAPAGLEQMFLEVAREKGSGLFVFAMEPAMLDRCHVQNALTRRAVCITL